MTRTGVMANAEEVAELKQLATYAAQTPVITPGMGVPDAASLAWERCRKRTHEIALSHGLPEIPGYYGIDLENGEFVRA